MPFQKDARGASILMACVFKAGGDPVCSHFPLVYTPYFMSVCRRSSIGPSRNSSSGCPPKTRHQMTYRSVPQCSRSSARHSLCRRPWYFYFYCLGEAYPHFTLFRKHDAFIAQDTLLLALIKDPSISAILKEAGLTEASLKTAIQQARGNRHIESKNAEEGFDALNK